MNAGSASGLVGIVSAIGAATLQNDPSPSASLLVPLTSGAIGFAGSYGILKASVAALHREIQTLRHDTRNHQMSQQSLLTEALERISRIEGRLHNRD